MKPTLTELAQKYGCDKLYAHSYIEFYTTLFEGRDVKRLLEIGIGYRGLMEPFVPFYIHGASLRMWSEYWPDAKIYGVDIRPETMFNEGNIETHIVDQMNDLDLRLLAVVCKHHSVDVVIDDGSHEPESQIKTARAIWPSMKLGSVYVIEDCREPDRVVMELGNGEIHRFDKRADDCLIVVRR